MLVSFPVRVVWEKDYTQVHACPKIVKHSLDAGSDEEKGGGVGQSPMVVTDEVSTEREGKGWEGGREGG